jgi:hypothetical protein
MCGICTDSYDALIGGHTTRANCTTVEVNVVQPQGLLHVRAV